MAFTKQERLEHIERVKVKIERIETKRDEIIKAIEFLESSDSPEFPLTVERLKFDVKRYERDIEKSHEIIEDMKKKIESGDDEKRESLQLKGSPL